MNRIEMLNGRLSVGNVSFVPMKERALPETKSDNPLMNLIFSPDENGFLDGDLSHFLSEKTNPEVKAFIESQLLRENSDSSSSLSIPDDVLNKMKSTISDDDIAFFSREHNETPEQYAYRIGKYLHEEKAKNFAKAKFEREKSRLESLGIKFD